ncbi:hypothetical protein SAMN05444412_12626 [Rhodonellum ikkaensis]|nr:hypothetical protein SAMN05444412_12626 [Rhodonellum ikkaensis]
MIDVIFGAIFSLGFVKLDAAFRRISLKSTKEAIQHLFVAAGFLLFVFYYVSAYHMMIRVFPYTFSPYSGFRLFVDLILLFHAMAILTRSMGLHPEKSTMGILIAMSVWHFGASIWQLMAAVEYGGGFQNINPVVFIPHYYFILIYWVVFWTWKFIAKKKRLSALATSRSLIFLLSFSAFAVSIYRYVQLYRLFGEGF